MMAAGMKMGEQKAQQQMQAQQQQQAAVEQARQDGAAQAQAAAPAPAAGGMSDATIAQAETTGRPSYIGCLIGRRVRSCQEKAPGLIHPGKFFSSGNSNHYRWKAVD